MAYVRDSQPLQCSIRVDSGNHVRASALEDAMAEYPLWSVHALLEEKVSGKCHLAAEGRLLAIIGITFFACTSVMVLFCLGYEIYARVCAARMYTYHSVQTNE